MQCVRLFLAAILVSSASEAAVHVVTSEDNSNAAGLAQAIAQLKDGDVIQFNIPGTGPHLIQTPVDGYAFITNNNIVIDGYSQPGATPNSNGILSSNNARIQIVLDSRNGNFTLMDNVSMNPADDPGYSGEAGILGLVGTTNVTIRGLSFVGPSSVGDSGDVSLYSVALARGASGTHLAGNWFGLLPDGSTVAGTADGIAGFRYRARDENGETTNTFLINNTIVGVAKDSTNAPAEFNVFLGQPQIPIALEGDGTRIAGNFLMVYPNGTNDFNVTDQIPGSGFEGAIEIGRGGNNTIIGVDGDGVNDANERNIIGGTYPVAKGGYDHTIEFYGNNPGTNIVVAGNYVGLGIDGVTRFTNGVPVLNASGGSAQYRFGSDEDGVSDSIEGNVVYNNWPPDIFDPAEFAAIPEQLNFFDSLDVAGTVSFRGNTLVNNFPAPASPLRNAGDFLTNYMSKVLADAPSGIAPVLSAEGTTDHLKGTIPLPAEGFSAGLDLYTVDPEGVQTGVATGVPEFASGWIQGKQYLGSFPVDTAGDQDAAAGGFDFDITSLHLGTNVQLTATANYFLTSTNLHGAAVVTSPFSLPITLQQGSGGQPGGDVTITNVSVSGSSVVISWTGGTAPFTVEKKASLDSTSQWSSAATVNTPTTTVPNDSRMSFFRVRSSQ